MLIIEYKIVYCFTAHEQVVKAILLRTDEIGYNRENILKWF